MRKHRHPSSFRDPDSCVYMTAMCECIFLQREKKNFIVSDCSRILVAELPALYENLEMNKSNLLSDRLHPIYFIQHRMVFEQLQVALTLEHDFWIRCSLKDASSYNVQFQGVYPCFRSWVFWALQEVCLGCLQSRIFSSPSHFITSRFRTKWNFRYNCLI